MMRRFLAVFMSMMMVVAMCGCTQTTEDSVSGNGEAGVKSERPAFIVAKADLYDSSLTPAVKNVSIADDFSNVINYDYFEPYFSDDALKKLRENGFVVMEGYNNEFYELYEGNRYEFIPNFITADSMMHSYHLYFTKLLKGLESDYFSESLTSVSSALALKSQEQYKALKGTDWENAALRNTAFFTVGAAILDENTEIPDDVSGVVSQELEKIESADGIYDSPVMNMAADGKEASNDPVQEDYSQYIPRGYYTSSEELSRYFKAMMWYGRLTFLRSSDDQTKSAVLMTIALNNDQETQKQWENVYTITSFFAGASDDPGFYEYKPLIEEVYGGIPEATALPEKTAEWKSFMSGVKTLRAPIINSIPVFEDQDKETAISGFRFMGQRATLDAAVFQKLIYQEVGENSAGDKRMLPSALDVTAAFGSDTAEKILMDKGNGDFDNYSDNLNKMKDYYGKISDDFWDASLYNSWTHTLTPLLETKGEGYPSFMQNDAWSRKNLSSFLGSWTELKHDTILYAKQVYAEMGGGEEEEMDDRGYVEPEPVLYSRLANLTSETKEGLENYGVLSDKDAEMLGLLSDLAKQLMTISEKELKGEKLTSEEEELIKSYGGQLEHFWYEALKDMSPDEVPSTLENPAAIVADVATNPEGTVLEEATGQIDNIFVIVTIDGTPRIAKGGVFSYYEFEQPLSERLTDEKWREMLGISISYDENGNYVDNTVDVSKPDWTDSYVGKSK